MEFSAMNSTFYISVTDCKIPNWKVMIHQWIDYVEREWSRFQIDNELARINQLETGELLSLSPPLFDVLLRADNYRKKTGGLFSPYLLRQMQYHGYDQSFPFCSSAVKETEMPLVSSMTTLPFEFHQNTFSIKRIAEGDVDLGGIGKGYAVESAAEWLKNIGGASAGIVDGGGDLTVWSNGDKIWTIGVADPFHEDREIAKFDIKNGSVATSNIIFRKWKHGNTQKHHILNGRTGEPVESSLIQATVLTQNCLDAEVCAKLCFMKNKNERTELLKKISSTYSYLLVANNGKIVVS